MSRTWRARVWVRRSRSSRPVLPSWSKKVCHAGLKSGSASGAGVASGSAIGCMGARAAMPGMGAKGAIAFVLCKAEPWLCDCVCVSTSVVGEHLPCSSSKCPLSAGCARPFTTSSKRGLATDSEGGEDGFCTVAALSHRLWVVAWLSDCCAVCLVASQIQREGELFAGRHPHGGLRHF